MPLGVVLSARGDLQGRLQRIKEAGFPTIQLVSPSEADLADPRRSELVAIILRSGVRVTSVAAVYAGESYADVAAVRATVGLLPRETRTARIEHTKRCGDFAHAVNALNLSSHIGYIPEDRQDADYHGVVAAVQEVCDHLAASKQSFCLETGQETAALLKDFIGDVGRPNLHVNFDPANMIMYGTGDPIEALGVLAPWVRGIHCKDGEWPKSAGQLGEEKRLGEGQVGIERFLAKLNEVGYEGPLTIEREIGGEQQMLDFIAAKKLLEQTKAKLGAA
jgi:sugar phosphate isomerase/epimerase